MEVIRRVHAVKEVCARARSKGLRVGLVPTMGALHEGHLSLIRRVQELSDISIVSIFVNPTQFGPGEDLEDYPRSLAGDADSCVAERVDYVFAPEVNEIYPPNSKTFVEVDELSTRLEGASRPGHFRGVATVVHKLFQIVRPAIAAFGQKDAQQAVIIRRMVRDLMLDVEILVLPTVRDSDGLALSSRNRLLSADQRKAATLIPQSIELATHSVAEGQRSAAKLVASIRGVLESSPLAVIDYVEIVDIEQLRPVSQLSGDVLLLIAVVVGGTRLIDNVVLRG